MFHGSLHDSLPLADGCVVFIEFDLRFYAVEDTLLVLGLFRAGEESAGRNCALGLLQYSADVTLHVFEVFKDNSEDRVHRASNDGPPLINDHLLGCLLQAGAPLESWEHFSGPDALAERRDNRGQDL